MPGPQLLTSVSFAITLQLQFERFKQFAFERFNNSRLRRISKSRLRGSSNFGWHNQQQVKLFSERNQLATIC